MPPRRVRVRSPLQMPFVSLWLTLPSLVLMLPRWVAPHLWLQLEPQFFVASSFQGNLFLNVLNLVLVFLSPGAVATP